MNTDTPSLAKAMSDMQKAIGRSVEVLLPPPVDKIDWLMTAAIQIFSGVQQILSTLDDLKNATDQLAQTDSAIAQGMTALTAAIGRLETDFQNLVHSGALTAEQQATLDASVKAVTQASSDIASAASQLATETASINTADPAPTPAPTPPASGSLPNAREEPR